MLVDPGELHGDCNQWDALSRYLEDGNLPTKVSPWLRQTLDDVSA